MFTTVGVEVEATDAGTDTEDPCPHGLPAWLCDTPCHPWCDGSCNDPCDGLCDADELPDPDVGPVVDLDLIPGARLALACQAAGAVPALLTDAEMLDVVEGTEKLLRWAEGLRTRILAGFADRHPTGTSAAPPGADPAAAAPVSRWLPDEVGLTLGISRLDALGEIARAQRFSHVLPDTLDALEHGRIDQRRADVIARATAVLPDDKARAVEATVLPGAPDKTLRQVQDRLRRMIARVDPDGQYRRHREARTERRISIRSLDEGMASLWFYGPADQIEAAWQMADRLARALGPDDPRTLDQRRFDLAVQILQGKLTVTDLSDIDATVTSALTTTTPAPNSETPDGAAPDCGTSGCGTSGCGTSKHETPGPETPDCRSGRSEDRRPVDAATPDAASPSTASPSTASPSTASPSTASPSTASPSTASPSTASTGAARPGDPPAVRIPPEALTEAVVQALAQRPDPHTTVQTPLIHVVVGLDTLLGSNDQPAELVGHGPLDADTARVLAADGVWKRLVTDPLSGTLLNHGRTTYTPPAGLADHVRARDQVCRGPHCSRRIRDLDHHQPWARGGPTSEPNLHGLCRHHHQLKDAPGWNVLAHPDRSLTWISPYGRRHTTTPYDYRPFTDTLPRPGESGLHADSDDGRSGAVQPGRTGPEPGGQYEPTVREGPERDAAPPF